MDSAAATRATKRFDDEALTSGCVGPVRNPTLAVVWTWKPVTECDERSVRLRLGWVTAPK